MKLSRSELWAIVITAVFLIFTGIWHASARRSVPEFHAAAARTTEVISGTEAPVRDISADAGGAGAVNINTAGVEELQTLAGIGAVLARRIVEDREANGPFQSPEALTRVSGVGQKTLEANRDRITT